jgi:hypothetical protein
MLKKLLVGFMMIALLFAGVAMAGGIEDVDCPCGCGMKAIDCLCASAIKALHEAGFTDADIKNYVEHQGG